MKAYSAVLVILSSLTAVPLTAQTQIGGGICSSASLSGTYSLTLTGRDLSSSVTFSKISQGIGTATFDGQSKVIFSLTTNTNSAPGVPQNLSGTYSLQANCIGVLNLATGDTASFTLEAFNNPTLSLSQNFLITGQDGVYSFTGSGSLVPSSCSASLLSGVYAFNATAFSLIAGSVSGVGNISGLLTFDGKSAVATTWYVSQTTTTTDTASGQYSVAPGCTATANVTDPAGTASTLTFTITATDGSNFIVAGASPLLMFTGSGRTL
jgi:hypothetical protein